MAPPSSISSSELAPTPAFWLAAATTLILGLALSAVAGYRGTRPAARSFPNIRREAYRYNALNGRQPSQVLLLGTSRMRHGVIEEELEKALGPGWQALNLGLDSAGLGEVERLVEQLDAPRGSGRRIAVLEVHPAEFDRGVCRRPPPLPAWRSLWPARRELTLWLPDLAYGWLAGHFPGAVSVPPPLPRLLWTVDAETRRRAVARMQPQALAAAARAWDFDGTCVNAVRSMTAALKARGFRVVLLETPSHSVYAAALALNAYRGAVLDPGSTGADTALSLPDARALGAGDEVFYDYSHLSPEGARLQTAKLAALLREF
jgi:hypothetical protein